MVLPEVIKQTIYFVLSYLGILIFFYIGVNFLSKGWLHTFLKVKMGRGKKQMTIIHSVTDTYFRPGMFKADGAYHYDTRSKSHKTLTKITREDVYSLMGVWVVEVDEATDTVYSHKGVAKAGIDATTADNLLKRVMMAPQLHKDFSLWILITCILILISVIIDIVQGSKGQKAIEALINSAKVI